MDFETLERVREVVVAPSRPAACWPTETSRPALANPAGPDWWDGFWPRTVTTSRGTGYSAPTEVPPRTSPPNN
jgi:hypothetical protein